MWNVSWMFFLVCASGFWLSNGWIRKLQAAQMVAGGWLRRHACASAAYRGWCLSRGSWLRDRSSRHTFHLSGIGSETYAADTALLWRQEGSLWVASRFLLKWVPLMLWGMDVCRKMLDAWPLIPGQKTAPHLTTTKCWLPGWYCRHAVTTFIQERIVMSGFQLQLLNYILF